MKIQKNLPCIKQCCWISNLPPQHCSGDAGFSWSPLFASWNAEMKQKWRKRRSSTWLPSQNGRGRCAAAHVGRTILQQHERHPSAHKINPKVQQPMRESCWATASYTPSFLTPHKFWNSSSFLLIFCWVISPNYHFLKSWAIPNPIKTLQFNLIPYLHYNLFFFVIQSGRYLPPLVLLFAIDGRRWHCRLPLPLTTIACHHWRSCSSHH